MKKFSITIALITLLFNLSCKKDKLDSFITISGIIENSTDSILTIVGGKTNKQIKLGLDGSFKDTLKVKETKLYRMFLNRSKSGFIFLKNGYNLELSGNSDNFFYGFKYKGKEAGADSNNLLVDQHNYSKKTGSPKSFLSLDKNNFNKKINRINREIDSINDYYKKADTIILNISNKNKKRFIYIIEGMYKQNYDFQ